MIKMKSLMPIILLSILLIAGTASAATLTPVGNLTLCPNRVPIALNVNDVTGIDAFDITVTGTGLTTTTSDVSKTGSIAANWMVYNVSAVTGGVRILAAGGTGSGSTGAGNLGTIEFTATDGTVDTETVAVVVNSVTTGITLTPAAYTPVDCNVPPGCSVWDDVLAKYNAYIGPPVTATWAQVIACYTAYVGTR
jgi:hypothetical protein